MGHTTIFRRVTRGRHGAEGVTERVEQRHAADSQKQSLDQIQNKIDNPQPDQGILGPGDELFFSQDLSGA